MSCTEPVQNQRAPQGVKNSSLRPDFPSISWLPLLPVFSQSPKMSKPLLYFSYFLPNSVRPVSAQKHLEAFFPPIFSGAKNRPRPPQNPAGRCLQSCPSSNQIASASKCVDTPPMFSNVFFCPTRFAWAGTFWIRSMRFAPPRLLPCHHQITSNNVLKHARRNNQKNA